MEQSVELLAGQVAEAQACLAERQVLPVGELCSCLLYTSTLGSHHASGPVIDFRKGDTVEHDVFGRGLVLSVLPTGNDKMLEIAFDQIGTKRLMANFAASRMKKL